MHTSRTSHWQTLPLASAATFFLLLGDLGDDVSAKRLVMLHVRTMYAFDNRTHGHIPNFDEFAFYVRPKHREIA